MAIRYRRYQASNFRLGRQVSVRELELTAAIVFVTLITYFATRITTATLWIVFSCVVVLGVVFGGIFFIVFQRNWRRNARAMQVMGVLDIDNITQPYFESYIETLLHAQGFRTMLAHHQTKDGTLLLAQKGHKTMGILLVRQDIPVHSSIVHRAIIRRAHYGYSATMVIATTTFTPAAKRMALGHRHCLLIDRQRLARWILHFQEGR